MRILFPDSAILSPLFCVQVKIFSTLNFGNTSFLFTTTVYRPESIVCSCDPFFLGPPPGGEMHTPDPPWMGPNRAPRVLTRSLIHTRCRLLFRRFLAVFNLEGVVYLADEPSIHCGCVSPHHRAAGFLPNASRISLCPEGWDSAYFPLVGGGGWITVKSS